MTKKFYAIREGARTGIFDNWEECKEYVQGITNAKFKSFRTLEEAEEYMRGDVGKEEKSNVNIEKAVSELSAGEAIAFVDGSYLDGRSGYGVLILLPKGKEVTLSKGFTLKSAGKDFMQSRNISAEIEGAKAAMQWAVDHNIDKLNLYYDYIGIEMWATGGWEAKKNLTWAYEAFCRNVMKKVDVQFFKVQGHTGIKYNEIVDSLAKEAAQNAR